ncbi:unnamed protein product [Heterobilharzia americana]|nr:unnamed protein product [Heterobilharzia americana]
MGGASRLNSVNQSVQAPKARTGSKLNSITEQKSVTTSLNSSSSNQKNRPASVLSIKEQLLKEKRQNLIKNMENKEERLRAFQEAQKQKMEARKKANEERFLAVQQRYQQMLQGIQVKENTSSTNNISIQKQKHSTNAKSNQTTKKCFVNLNLTDHNTLQVQNKTITVIKKPLLDSNQKPQSTVKVNTSQLNEQSQVSEKNTVSPKVPIINSPTVNESFNISLLNSDSESENDELNIKVPSWCRRGNPEFIATLSALCSNQLRWQDELRPASLIPIDIDDMFHGYKYTNRTRESSAIWDSPYGNPTRSPNTSLSMKIPL